MGPRKYMAKETQPTRLERSPIHLLHRAGQCAGDIFQAEMGGGDLTPRQYAVLVTVSQNEGLSQTSLVEKTGIDRSTLADIVRYQTAGAMSMLDHVARNADQWRWA